MDETTGAKEPLRYAMSILGIGYAEFTQGKFEEGIRDTSVAQRLFEELKNETFVQVCNVMIGVCYRSLGEIDIALKHLLSSYKHLSKVNEQKIFLLYSAYSLAELYKIGRAHV